MYKITRTETICVVILPLLQVTQQETDARLHLLTHRPRDSKTRLEVSRLSLPATFTTRYVVRQKCPSRMLIYQIEFCNFNVDISMPVIQV